ncbi:MAG: 16S rRNA (cytidine(1402)-2'-O)-methyltransferase [Gammaproteobacteria bacterium]|nr:MAG: 16S rRNA (cytidine(1402)-2'-O)-methyltransferase [Gammaproteobacteria bacterium]
MKRLPDNACLYVVATPIGNLGDISERAVETLTRVDLIYAEDTRQTHKLLQHFGIKNTIYQLHKHNEGGQKTDIARQLDQGKSVAIVSDAGTPLIADPGYVTLAYLRERGYAVKVIPGCSAVIAALSISGLPSDNFQFIGFVPSKAKQRQDFLRQLQYCQQTTVFFETPHRIKDCLADCLHIFGGQRQIFIGRELTKQFEDSVLLPLSQAQTWISADTKRQKGEFVVVLSAGTETPPGDWQALARLLLAENLSTKSIAAVVANYTGENKKAVYQYVVSLNHRA